MKETCAQTGWRVLVTGDAKNSSVSKGQEHGRLQNTNFSTRPRVKVLLKLRMRADLAIYPALSSKSCNQRCVRQLSFILARFAFYTCPTPKRASFYRTLTDVYDGVRSGRIALQYPQGKADQQQLHLGISARRLIQALLGCPIPSKWNTQIKKGEREREQDDQNPGQTRSTVLLLADKTRMKACGFFFFKLSLSLKQQPKGKKKQLDHRKVGSNDK